MKIKPFRKQWLVFGSCLLILIVGKIGERIFYDLNTKRKRKIMQVNTNKWMRDFNKEIKPVRKLFCSTTLLGSLHDYYEIKVNNGNLSIVLMNKEELPKNIAGALYKAFNNSLSKNIA